MEKVWSELVIIPLLSLHKVSYCNFCTLIVWTGFFLWMKDGYVGRGLSCTFHKFRSLHWAMKQWSLWKLYRDIQWWFVILGSDSPKISLIRTKSARTDFLFWTNGRFSNPENSLIRKYQLGTNVSGLKNHHCSWNTRTVNIMSHSITFLKHLSWNEETLFISNVTVSVTFSICSTFHLQFCFSTGLLSFLYSSDKRFLGISPWILGGKIWNFHKI